MFNLDKLIQDTGVVKYPQDLRFLTLSGRKLFHNQNFKGQGVVVAVIDTGVSKHPDFEDRLLPGVNLNSSYPPNYKDTSTDDNMHGTHVAGAIASSICGVAPKAKILPIKVLDADGSCDTSDLIPALNYAKNWKGPNGERVDVVNMSLGCPASYLEQQPTVLNAMHKAIQDLVNAGIVVNCAAGNSGKLEAEYPEHFDEVISVGAADVNKQIANFTTKDNEVDVCQVGVNVTSCYYKGGYITLSGTSMATPMVSGIAALLISKFKSIFKTYMPEPFVYQSLKLNTIDVGLPGIDVSSGAGFCCLNPNPLRIELTADNGSMIINNIKYALGSPVKVSNGVASGPIRNIFESFGSFVTWDGISKKIYIDY
jgi:major intracellular serine protease